MRHLLFLLLLGWCELSWAQHWRADWQTEGLPSATSWRYDREAFHQERGHLYLAVPDAMTAGRVSLMTNLDLPSAPCWQGTLHLGLQPTSSNYPLILLCATEVLSDTSYEYLALDFGGQTARSVSLVRVQATRAVGTPQITMLSDHPPLITSPQLLLAGQDLAFRLLYAPKTGWRLYLKDLANDRDFILDILNYQMRDIFAQLGFNTDGGEFVYAKKEKVDTARQIDIVQKLSSMGLPIDDDYLYETFGVAKPENYNELKAKKEEERAALRERLAQEPEPPREPERKAPTNALHRFFGLAPTPIGADNDF